jgi:glycosyltransferase involved in cell wall biosynthesis
MDISVIIPLLNEEESLPELESWLRRVLEGGNYKYEIIFIDDGSTDSSWEVIESLSKKNEHIKAIKFRMNHGKSAALNEGFQAASGSVVITMDADLQDSPDEIPDLYNMIIQQNFDLVSGWKKKRHDPLGKTLPSKLFNRTTALVSGINLNDFNCGLKAYKLKVVKSIEVFGEMHRYIPVIAKWSGFKNIGEKVVEHRARQYGISKFGWTRLITGFLDLLSIVFVGKFGKRPMHLFGSLGVLSVGIGFVILSYLSISKMLFSQWGLTERPLFYFGILALIVGSQLFLTGFLAELISRNAPNRNFYFIEKKLKL